MKSILSENIDKLLSDETQPLHLREHYAVLVFVAYMLANTVFDDELFPRRKEKKDFVN